MVIEGKELSKIYGSGENRVVALDKASLIITPGDLISIMGPSGSGKSTLLHLLSGLDQPTSGTLTYDGKDIYSLSDKELSAFRRRRVGFIFQQFHLLPVLTARENIIMPLLLDKRQPDEGYLEHLTELLGISDRLSHLPHELSGGQQQRVAIARALITKPDVIFADEPTGNLDSKSGGEVMLSPKIFLARDAGELARLIGESSGGKGPFLLASAAVTLFFALIAALPAARYAARVSPTVAMAGSRGKIKRRSRRVRKIRRFEAFYARLNLKRSRGRTVITVLSLVMSITVFIALQSAVGLLDASAGGVAEHYGDYSITNETVGFSPEEYRAMEADPRVETLTAMQFSYYEQGTDGYPVGIGFGFPLQPAETFQVLGLNGPYWDRAFSSLSRELLEKLKAGEGCVVRNPLPLIYEGEEIPRTEIKAGDTITVAGREVTVLHTLDGYDGYLSVGNSGFINGVQVVVNKELYAALTGKTTYNELLPTLAEGVDRAEYDTEVAALAERVPGTIWLSYEDTDRQLAESFAQIKLLAWGLILFVALIGLLNIVNTVYTNVHTRVKEIGMQRAIGMSAGSLYKVFLWEGVYYGLIASTVGGALGYICAVFVGAATTDTLQLVPVPVLPMVEAAVLAVAACLLATCVPLRRVGRLSAVEAIENVE